MPINLDFGQLPGGKHPKLDGITRSLLFIIILQAVVERVFEHSPIKTNKKSKGKGNII